jgi:putative isomerase
VVCWLARSKDNLEALSVLQNQIDIRRVPFSDRGSRLLVYQHTDKPALYIKLAERLIRVEPGIESYLRRPPFIEDLCFIDESGKALEFTTITSPERLMFQTQLGDFNLVFHDLNTLVFGLPENQTVGVSFRIRLTHSHVTETGGGINHVRDFNYKTNSEVTLNQTSFDCGDMVVHFIVKSKQDSSITFDFNQSDNLTQSNLSFSTARESAKKRWAEWFQSAPDVIEPYRQKYAYAWWMMANNLIHPSGYITHEAMVPTKAFYVGVWLWDSALHAIAFRQIDPQLAQDQIRVMLAHQLPDGMLPDAIFDEGIVSEIGHPFHGKVTKPPILAWAALKIHEVYPDIQFLKEIYEPLVKCNDWWFHYNDDDQDGIVQYTHPYSSGLDDSPLWDHGMPVESPDINTYLVMQMQALSEIAKQIGRVDEAQVWQTKSEELLKRMIEHLWDEEAGVFQSLHNEKPIPVLTPLNLLPLWTGQLPEEIKNKLLAHLTNSETFWGKFGLPTVAFNDPAYNPEKMWRGPVWANINYFFIDALQRINEHELANELRDKTLNLIANQPDIREYYNSQTGQSPKSAAPIFGWSAAVFIELALQATKNQKKQ